MPAGTANACVLAVLIWKQEKGGAKIFLNPVYTLAAILTLPSTADFIQLWHSNAMKTSLVKMPSYTLFMCSIVFTAAFWCCFLKGKKKKSNSQTNPLKICYSLGKNALHISSCSAELCNWLEQWLFPFLKTKEGFWKNLNTSRVLFNTAYIFSE